MERFVLTFIMKFKWNTTGLFKKNCLVLIPGNVCLNMVVPLRHCFINETTSSQDRLIIAVANQRWNRWVYPDADVCSVKVNTFGEPYNDKIKHFVNLIRFFFSRGGREVSFMTIIWAEYWRTVSDNQTQHRKISIRLFCTRWNLDTTCYIAMRISITLKGNGGGKKYPS